MIHDANFARASLANHEIIVISSPCRELETIVVILRHQIEEDKNSCLWSHLIPIVIKHKVLDVSYLIVSTNLAISKRRIIQPWTVGQPTTEVEATTCRWNYKQSYNGKGCSP